MHKPSLVIRILAKMFFGTLERVRVWKKLETQIRNNMRLEEALQQLCRHAKESKSPLEEVYLHILNVLGHGQTLDVALEGLASNEEIMLIGSAQASGRLTEGFALAIKVLEAKSAIKKSLVSNLSAPCLMMVACIAMMVMIAVHVMPQLALVSDPARWTGSSYVLYVLSNFIGSWTGALTGIGFLAALLAIIISFPLFTGKFRRIADRFLPWSIYRLTVGTVWLYTVATRMQAGNALPTILASMTTAASTPYLREIVTAILQHSRHGEDFGTALRESGMTFPSKEVVDDMQVYAKMPGFQKNMAVIADTWLEDGVELIKSYAQKIGVFVNLVIMGQLILISLVASDFQNQVQVGGM